MLRRARRTILRRDEVHVPHVFAFDSSKPTMVDTFNPLAPERDHKPSAPGPLGLECGTDARRFRFRFQPCARHTVSLLFSPCTSISDHLTRRFMTTNWISDSILVSFVHYNARARI